MVGEAVDQPGTTIESRIAAIRAQRKELVTRLAKAVDAGLIGEAALPEHELALLDEEDREATSCV
jgi:hypothetical protein